MATGDSIDSALISAFSSTVFELAAQTKARYRPYVETVPVDAEDMFFDRLASVEARTLTDRFSNANFDDIQWDRRRLITDRIAIVLPVDKRDVERMLIDPQSELAKRAVQGLERKFDRIVQAALFATVMTGRSGTVAVSAATDGVLTVNATAGLTYDKLLEIKQNFIDNEISIEQKQQIGLFIAGKEHTALMGEAELTSGDFTRQYAVEGGEMVKAVGMDINLFGGAVDNPILPVSGGVRDCAALASGGVKVGITRMWNILVEKRTDKIDTWQIVATGVIGAVRMEGERVQKVQTTA